MAPPTLPPVPTATTSSKVIGTFSTTAAAAKIALALSPPTEKTPLPSTIWYGFTCIATFTAAVVIACKSPSFTTAGNDAILAVGLSMGSASPKSPNGMLTDSLFSAPPPPPPPTASMPLTTFITSSAKLCNVEHVTAVATSCLSDSWHERSLIPPQLCFRGAASDADAPAALSVTASRMKREKCSSVKLVSSTLASSSSFPRVWGAGAACALCSSINPELSSEVGVVSYSDTGPKASR
mmetsp:Transcript_18330/g.22742  ORF Transcript_18330/g.22742 Transcript_18330/m.22742 type:complete len:238 (+) Transcript_18330:1673-2386(+)